MRKLLLVSSALASIILLAASAFAGDLTVNLSGYDTAMFGVSKKARRSTRKPKRSSAQPRDRSPEYRSHGKPLGRHYQC